MMITDDPRSARWARTCWVVLMLTIVVLASAGQGRAAGQDPGASWTGSTPAAGDGCPGWPSPQEWPGTVPLDGGEHRLVSDAYVTFLSGGCGLPET